MQTACSLTDPSSAYPRDACTSARIRTSRLLIEQATRPRRLCRRYSVSPASTAGLLSPPALPRNAVLSVADKVVDGVKSGAIRHFFLVGGCDGARPGRNYYTEFRQADPAGHRRPHARLRQIPLQRPRPRHRSAAFRVCWTSASATTPTAPFRSRWRWPTLSAATVNELPLSMVLSAGTSRRPSASCSRSCTSASRDIRLGPTLPAFLSPNVLNFLAEHYAIAPTSTPEADLAALLS